DSTFSNRPPNLPPNISTLMKWAVGCAIACPHAGEILQEAENLKDWAEKFNQQTQSNQNQKDNKTNNMVDNKGTAQTHIGSPLPTTAISVPDKQANDGNGNIKP